MSQIMQTWPVMVGDAPQTDLPGYSVKRAVDVTTI
jgi:hypothetical protein